MGGDISGIIQEDVIHPSALDVELPTPPIYYGMEVGGVSFLHAESNSLGSSTARKPSHLVDLHEGGLKGVLLKPLLSVRLTKLDTTSSDCIE